MDRYPYHEYTILLGATRTLAHIGVHFTHRVFGLSPTGTPVSDKSCLCISPVVPTGTPVSDKARI